MFMKRIFLSFILVVICQIASAQVWATDIVPIDTADCKATLEYANYLIDIADTTKANKYYKIALRGLKQKITEESDFSDILSYIDANIFVAENNRQEESYHFSTSLYAEAIKWLMFIDGHLSENTPDDIKSTLLSYITYAKTRLGYLYWGAGQYAKCDECFQELDNYIETHSKDIDGEELLNSQITIADFYCEWGIYSKAVEWYDKAARSGDVYAQEMLGEAYYYGYGVDKDNEQSFYWFEKAAMAGSPFAQSWIGEFYHNGWGVKQSNMKALEWFTAAANSNDIDAQRFLGKYYRDGISVKQNLPEALRWFSLAAQKGDLESQKAIEIINMSDKEVIDYFALVENNEPFINLESIYGRVLGISDWWNMEAIRTLVKLYCYNFSIGSGELDGTLMDFMMEGKGRDVLWMPTTIWSSFAMICQNNASMEFILTIFDSIKDNPAIMSDNEFYPLILEEIGNRYMSVDISQAEDYFRRSIEIISNATDNETSKQSDLDRAHFYLANCAFARGDYHSAFMQYSEINGECSDFNYVSWGAQLAFKKAICELYLGDYNKALSLVYNSIMPTLMKINGSWVDMYFHVFKFLGDYYKDLSNYEKALQYYTDVNDYSLSHNQLQNSYIASIQIADCLLSKGNVELAGKYIEDAMHNRDTIDVWGAPIIQDGIVSVKYHLAVDNIDEAINAYNVTLAYINDNKLGNSLESAQLELLMGETLLHSTDQTQSQQAIEHLKHAERILRTSGFEHSTLYYDVCYSLTKAEIMLKATTSISNEKLYTLAEELYTDKILQTSTNDRIGLWNIQEDAKSIFFSTNDLVENPHIAYKYILLTKGILLESDLEILKSINSKNDEKINANYQEILKIRNLLRNFDITEDYKINTDSLSQVLQRREIFLISKLKETNSFHIKQHDWTEIQKLLKSNQVAIEYINYYDLNTSKEVYAAFIINKRCKQPIFVPLCEAGQLHKLIHNDAKKLYSSKSFVAKSIYDLLWKPIAKHIKPKAEVFFSPDGILHQFSVESLPNEDGKQIDELYNVHRVSSTKRICDSDEQKEYKNAVLYGGLTYDVDYFTMLSQSLPYNQGGKRIEPSISYTRGSGVKLDYLSGTEREVSYILGKLDYADINTEVYTDVQGNEESFKNLSNKNIDLLHIATHGFYFPEEDVKTTEFYQNFARVDNPLMRSGLALSGSKAAWDGEFNTYGMEDGILTSSEIADMNLQNVDLLVLSACQTGLGDIGQDGVYGLQRAFKLAGVDTIIMSLWNVNDTATEKMMTKFYEELLAGKSKHGAFTAAKAYVKAWNDDPRYWAAFIMLD